MAPAPPPAVVRTSTSPQGGGEGGRLERVVLSRSIERSATRSPPPCGEGLGVGVSAQRFETMAPTRGSILRTRIHGAKRVAFFRKRLKETDLRHVLPTGRIVRFQVVTSRARVVRVLCVTP